MRVEIEVELDDTVLSVRSVVAARLMGTAAGKMLAAIGAGSDVPMSVLVVEFNEAVARSARCAPATSDHTCDRVGCC